MQLLRIDSETLRTWGHEGFLPVASRVMNERHYTVESVDKLLREGARNFAAPPTADDLLTGRLVLLPAPEAQEVLGVSFYVMLERVSSGRLATVKFRNEQRYSLQSIQQYLAASSAHRLDLIPRKLALHVMGVSAGILKGLIKAGVLECESVSEDLHLRPFTRDSFLRALKLMLPGWISPEDWLEDRQESKLPLATPQYARGMLQVDGPGLRRLMERRALLHIFKPGGLNWKFMPESLAAYLEAQPILLQREMAMYFGVTTTSLQQWWGSGALACPAPGHVHGSEWAYTRACLRAILAQCLSQGMQVGPWCKWREEKEAPLLSDVQAAKALRTERRKVLALAQSGSLRGLHLPGGGWRFTERQLEHYRSRQRAA
jgi:hypothetical protein